MADKPANEKRLHDYFVDEDPAAAWGVPLEELPMKPGAKKRQGIGFEKEPGKKEEDG